MRTETKTDVDHTIRVISRSRRRLLADAGLVACAALGAAKATADAGKRKKKPSTRTITRTFVNDGQIRVPANFNGGGAANPYPASITVSGMNGATVSSVTVTLKDVSHESGRELNVMLAKDTTNAILMGAAGGYNSFAGATIIFDDTAENALPQSTTLVSGRFQATSFINPEFLPNYFRAPAPLPSGNSLLSAFRGADPNGSWRLYASDSVIAIDGSISGGWELTITADVPKKKKKKKR